MRRGDAYSPDEDSIILTSRSPRTAYRKLRGRRTYAAIKRRKTVLLHPEPAPTVVMERPGQQFWTELEIETLRKRWPTAQTASDVAPFLSRFTLSQIRSKAGHLKLKRLFNGDDDVPFEGHRELLDQIRIRAKQDGVPLYKLDMQIGSGYYFRASNWKKDRINLLYVARAIEFFGGTLVIDWCDR